MTHRPFAANWVHSLNACFVEGRPAGVGRDLKFVAIVVTRAPVGTLMLTFSNGNAVRYAYTVT